MVIIIDNMKFISNKSDLRKLMYWQITINLFIYIINIYMINIVDQYNLLNESAKLDLKLLMLSMSYILFMLLLLLSYYITDVENEPIFTIFNGINKLDFFVKIVMIVVSFVNLYTNNNVKISISILFSGFLLNMLFWIYMMKEVKTISESKIEQVLLQKYKTEKKDYIDENYYKNSLKKAKVCFLMIVFLAPFSNLVDKLGALFIFYTIYSIVFLNNIKNIYFILYKNSIAIKKMVFKFIIMCMGFMLIILNKENVINIYEFSNNELIYFIGIAAWPMFYPTRKVYLRLKYNKSC